MKWPSFLRLLSTWIIALMAISSPSINADENQIDLSFEWIEVDLADWNDLLMEQQLPLRGAELSKALDGLIKENRATLLRQMSVKSRSGQRAKGEAIREMISPESYTPATLSSSGQAVIRPTVASSESRNIGTTVEFDPVIRRPIAEINLAAEITRHLGDREWGKDEAVVQFPDIYTMKLVTQLALKRGESRFIGSFEPSEANEPSRKQPRVLLFVRADFPEDKKSPVVHPDFPVAESGDQKSEPEPPINEIGLRYQVWETNLDDLNILLADSGISTAGEELRQALLQAKATVVDTIAVVGQVEKRFKIQSGLELRYPTDWDEPEISSDGNLTIPGSPAAFETMALGTTIELEVKRRDAGQYLVSGNFQNLQDRGVRRFGQDVSEVGFALTHRRELIHQVPMGDGELVFLGTLRPDQSTGTDHAQPIWCLFARIDSLP